MSHGHFWSILLENLEYVQYIIYKFILSTFRRTQHKNSFKAKMHKILVFMRQLGQSSLESPNPQALFDNPQHKLKDPQAPSYKICVKALVERLYQGCVVHWISSF